MQRKKGEWRVAWTPLAKIDLFEIGAYVSRTASHDTVETLISAIHAAGESVVHHPHLWRVRDELIHDVRFVPLQSYYICYRIKGELIEVLRIVHQRRDIVALFEEIESTI